MVKNMKHKVDDILTHVLSKLLVEEGKHSIRGRSLGWMHLTEGINYFLRREIFL